MNPEIDSSLDPLGLGINLQAVDTSSPVLRDGIYPATIKSADVVPNKKDPAKRNLRVQFTLDIDAPTVQDSTVAAGWPLSKYYPLQQSDNDKAPPFERDLTALVDASFGIKNAEDRPMGFPNPATLVGRQVRLRVKCTVNTQTDEKSNDITAVLIRE